MVAALEGDPVRPLPLPDRPAQIAAIIPSIDGEMQAADGRTESDASSDSFQEWLGQIVMQKGSRK
jgi:hypothetical protein